MDFIKEKIKPMYFKYLAAAFGSALVTSIYSIVDMAMVGQYQGPEGTAALAVVAPIWNVIYSLGLLFGIGGSVLYSTLKGQKGNDEKESNELFTTSVIGASLFSVLMWFIFIFFDKQLLTSFGGSGNLLTLGEDYLYPIKFVLPTFLINQMLSAFLRNDKNPTLATVAVLAGGIFNVFGDYVFIFTFDMGIFGAGLATALGSTLSFGIMMTHFISKKNTLKLVKPTRVLNKLYRIMITGFSTFFIDIAMGILTIVFNRQIMKYFGANALSIYGIIINISTFVQCCAYSVGQAAQPIISANFGAKQGLRIKETLKYALFTVLFFSIFWTALIMVKPMLFVDLFMTPTPEITSIAPSIMRAYGISFILLPLNIFSTYYFQAIIQPKTVFIISVGRGLVVSCLFIYLLPVILGKQSLWYAMFMTELIVAIYTVYKMSNSTKEFK
ncbi:MATE family efflux transporter, partial [Clostridium saudiense]|nr:MATE family efflux transporter [Clostridium saudiense]